MQSTSVGASPLSDGPADSFVVPLTQRSHGSLGDCDGLVGCAHPLLRWVQPRCRYTPPSQRRESFVCRFSHEGWCPTLCALSGCKCGRPLRPLIARHQVGGVCIVAAMWPVMARPHTFHCFAIGVRPGPNLHSHTAAVTLQHSSR